jgi:DNA polymerase V
MPLRRPTADKALLVGAALAGLRYIFRPGFKYAKARVILPDLQFDALTQQEQDLEADGAGKHDDAMKSLFEAKKPLGV